MNAEQHSHRFADIILNSDYELRTDIDHIVRSIQVSEIEVAYTDTNAQRLIAGKKSAQGKQPSLNQLFRTRFREKHWEAEKNVFSDPEHDLVIDFLKRGVGVDVAFNHRSFIGGDLLRLQAAAEVKNLIKVGVYICGTKEFCRYISKKDGNSLVSFERAKWYLNSFYPVITVPVMLIGLTP
jgi:hypothetical protein